MGFRKLAIAVGAVLAAITVPGVSQSVVLASSSSPPAWTQQSPAGSPSARYGAAMAYDKATGTAVLFGGQQIGDSSSLGDTWTCGERG